MTHDQNRDDFESSGKEQGVRLEALRDVSIPEEELRAIRRTVLHSRRGGSMGMTIGRRYAIPTVLILVALGLSVVSDGGKSDSEVPVQKAETAAMEEPMYTFQVALPDANASSGEAPEENVQHTFELDSGDPDIVILWVVDGVEVIDDDFDAAD